MRTLVRVGGVLVASAALGLLGGWLWWTWWAPATPGEIYDTDDGPHWYPNPWDPGMTDAFGGTAQYVAVAAGLGLLLGVGAGLVAGRTAVAVLGATILGSAVAAALMLWLGTSSSPPDPATLATAENVGKEVPGHLEVTGWTPYLAWPVAALAGYLVVMLSAKSISDGPRRDTDPETWLEPLSPSRSEQSTPS